MDGKDDLDAYLQRFERFADTAKWHRTGWASKLSALLSGQALEVYSRLSEEAARDYDKVKIALMKRYDLTEDGYRRKFRASKPELDESPDQFIVRLDRYLLRWLELSDTERTFDGLKDLIVKEQFIDSCPKDLAIHLRERAPETLAQIAKIADQYLEAHGKHLFSPVSRKPVVPPEREEPKNTQTNSTPLQCFKCNARGHRAANCPTIGKRCFLCGKQGHEARNCRSGGRRSGGQSRDGNPVQRGQVSASCLVQQIESKPTAEEVKSCIKDDKLLLACGKKIPLLSSACVEPLSGERSKMPVVKGRVGEKSVNVLRDTGCSGIVVKKDLVSEDQFTGDFNVMLLIDNTARKVPIAKIDVDTPYLKGQVEAQCLPDPIYNLVIGNVPGARAADDPDPNWQDHEVCVVTTRSQDKKAGESIPLIVPSTEGNPVVDREEPKQMQHVDSNLQEYEEALQQELHRNKSLMYETVSKLRVQEGEARQKDEVSDELKSELDTGNCLQREDKQFTGAEKLAKSKTLNREKDEEVNTVVTGLAAEKIRVEEATTVEVAVGVGANLSKNDDVKAEVEGVNPVDDVNFLEMSGYVATESGIDVATGDNLTSDQRAEFMDIAKQFQGGLSEQSRGIT